ncbi:MULTISPECIES: EAL domain-containing protein [unclassified Coleofasciculus]|uniref:EAL domain-containing protein n=1 Tax=unclassified Coleofasciculus TaxID=2692782 RepID=UPI001882E933|nr:MULTISPECIES: EAL domain-containing protein [unclassified Coleofasciculus]MBE9127970.1 EAL domain-containing protein [Coleofasciculus sp. LEGE 07081]MBE9149851.1 EAL domain-containing protein [Coleofasciculus sp. LEGE 07092]
MSKELLVLQSLIPAIAKAPDLDSALNVVLRQICAFTQWDYGEAWLPCPNQTVLTCSTAWYGNTPSLDPFRQARETLTFPPSTGLLRRVWTSQQPEWIEESSIQSDAVFVDTTLGAVAKFQGVFAVPILQEQRVLAVLAFFISQPRSEKKGLVELVTVIALQLGLAIAHKQVTEQLRQEQNFSQAVIETSSAFFVAIDARGKTIKMNQGLLNALGYTLDEIVGTDFLSTFIREIDREPLAKIVETLLGTPYLVSLLGLKQPTLNQTWVLAKNGREQLVEWRGKPLFKNNGELDYFFAVGTDITERRLIQQETARLASFPLLTPNPIVEIDLEGQVCYLNPEAMQSLPDLQERGVEHPFLGGIPSIGTIVQQENSLRREVKIGEVYYEQVLHYVCEIDCIRIYAFDISDRKRAEEQLIYNAFYDRLTGLANRALFVDRLKQAVRRNHQYRGYSSIHRSYHFAVLLLNFNRFKIVNESLGNPMGDKLLQEFAHRLLTCLHPTDTVARLGGDEFAILLEGIQDVGDAIRVAEAIQQTLATPFYLNGREVFMTLSIGIALNTISSGYKGGRDRIVQAENLLRNANLAIYRARSHGESRYEIFDTAMHSNALERLQLETDLRRAIERQEFRVYYQPIVSLLTGKIIGFEALLRWQHPQRGLVSPGEFIPIAEETGLITPIGWWTLREACHQLSIWQQTFKSDRPLTMNVNLSCKQFIQPDLLSQIDKILKETNLTVGSLKLEITESVVMDNPDLVKTLLLELKRRQIHLCIDDFGTGYSSLSRLHNFPISTLKIDRCFVSRIGALGENSEIVQAIVHLAKTLSMDVVAEGIEVLEQVSPLIALQCQYGQGFFFSKPVDSDAAGELLITERCQQQ